MVSLPLVINPGDPGHIEHHETIHALLGTINDAGSAVAATVPSPGALVDVGPALQAAFDDSRVVHLDPNGVYFIETAVFLDSTENNARYALYANGAKLVLSNSLPVPSTWNTGIGAAPPTAFFSGTLRGGLSAGTVDTSDAFGACNSPQLARLIIHDMWAQSGSTPGLLIFGGEASDNVGGTANGLDNVVLSGFRAGISWTGYADGNFAEHCAVGSNPAGGGTRILYQRDSGDATRAIGCKAYGGYIADLAGCNGFLVEAPVSGQISLAACNGQIVAGHQEADEAGSAVPWSVNIDRSHVTIVEHFSRASNAPTKYSVRVNDAAGLPYIASEVVIRGWRAIANYIAGQGDDAKGSDLHILALNHGGRVTVYDVRPLATETGVSAGWRGLTVTSADSDIQTALTDGADYIATGNFELGYDGDWHVTAPDRAIITPHDLNAPTVVAAAAGTNLGGSLANGTTYQYVVACKTAAGGYSALSATDGAVATATGAVTLDIENTSGATTIIVWRKTGAGVTATPDHYVEIGLDAPDTRWIDTGDNVNGLAWITSAIPVPNTVASTGQQQMFPFPSNEVLPWRSDISPHHPKATAGGWSTTIDTAQIGNGVFVSGAGQNDDADYTVVLAAGTWTLELIVITNNNKGIIHVQFDDDDAAFVDAGTIDCYSAGVVRNVKVSLTGIVIQKTKKRTMRLKMATKNASSAGYGVSISTIMLRRTA